MTGSESLCWSLLHLIPFNMVHLPTSYVGFNLIYVHVCVRCDSFVRCYDPSARSRSWYGDDWCHSQHAHFTVTDRRWTEDSNSCSVMCFTSECPLCHRAILQHSQTSRHAVENSACRGFSENEQGLQMVLCHLSDWIRLTVVSGTLELEVGRSLANVETWPKNWAKCLAQRHVTVWLGVTFAALCLCLFVAFCACHLH